MVEKHNVPVNFISLYYSHRHPFLGFPTSHNSARKTPVLPFSFYQVTKYALTVFSLKHINSEKPILIHGTELSISTMFPNKIL